MRDARQRERDEITAMVVRVRDFLGDAPDDLPFSRTVQNPTPWGTMEESVEETALTSADLRAMCDVVELLNESRLAVRAAYRAELRERVEGLDGVRREVEHMRKIADSDGAYLGGWGGQLRASANRAEAALDKLVALLDPEDGT